MQKIKHTKLILPFPDLRVDLLSGLQENNFIDINVFIMFINVSFYGFQTEHKLNKPVKVL